MSVLQLSSGRKDQNKKKLVFERLRLTVFATISFFEECTSLKGNPC